MMEEKIRNEGARPTTPHVTKHTFVINDPGRVPMTPEMGHIRLELDFSHADMARMQAIYAAIEAARGHATSASGFVHYCEAVLFEGWQELWQENHERATSRFKEEATTAITTIREAHEAVENGDDTGVGRRLDEARNAVETMEGLYGQMVMTKQ